MRGISFQPDMVAAIAEGIKTQTRQMLSDRPYKVGEVLYVKEGWARLSTGDILGGQRPAMFMPRHLARYYIKITAIRKQRLWNITEREAKAEGFYGSIDFGRKWESLYPSAPLYRKRKYNKKWDYAWDLNPEVVVYEFEREKKS